MLRLHEDHSIRALLEESDTRLCVGDLNSDHWEAIAAEVSATIVSGGAAGYPRVSDQFEGTLLYFPGVTLKMLTRKEGT
jgi:hypothetical protein